MSVSTTLSSSTPASDKLTEQQTKAPSDISTDDSPDAVQIPADKPSDSHSRPLSKSTKETGSTAPESSEQTPQECDSVAKQSAPEQDKTIAHETQSLSGRSDVKDNHTNTDQHTFTKQPDRKEDQAARDNNSDDSNTKKRHPVTKETAKSTQVVNNFHIAFIFQLLCCVIIFSSLTLKAWQQSWIQVVLLINYLFTKHLQL